MVAQEHTRVKYSVSGCSLYNPVKHKNPSPSAPESNTLTTSPQRQNMQYQNRQIGPLVNPLN